jgi:ribosome-associated toxin RatA of RatAB toxin-antitoxin module
MKKVEKSVVINRPREFVFMTICDFQNWPKLSPNFSNTNILLENANRHVSVMNSRHGLLNPPIVTTREFTNNYRIKFKHIVPAFPIKEHYGEWRFLEEIKGKTKVKLVHNFHCHLGIIGILIDNILIAPFFMGPHSQKMLEQMKMAIEMK